MRDLVKVYYDEDANISILKKETIAIVGYGNQGRPQALNMRDSGLRVVVGNIKDSYYDQAAKDGFNVQSISDATKQGTIICMMIPDEVQKSVYEAEIQAHLTGGKMLVFISGYSIHYGFITPPKDVDVVDLFPAAVGASVRERFVNKQSMGASMAVGQDATGKAKERTLALAKALGLTSGGIIETTFAYETEINLSLEQIVYPAIRRIFILAFETMVEAGYPPELVSLAMYVSNEPSEVFATFTELGFFEALKLWSTTAQYGTMTREPRIIKDDIKEIMREHLREIRTGVFAKEWALEMATGYPVFNKLRKEGLEHPMNEVEKRVKKMFRS
jgi:ketol-acid reductoisomerase